MNRINKVISSMSRVAVFAVLSSASILHAAPTTHEIWTDTTTAAAAAYCMAKHPAGTPGTYTADGYEFSDARNSGGIVGAVRRNFVEGELLANGLKQTCNQACAQAAIYPFPKSKDYPKLTAKALTRKIGDIIRADGISDFASKATVDSTNGAPDFTNGKSAVAAVWGRPNNFVEDDVAQSDLCCCHVVHTPY